MDFKDTQAIYMQIADFVCDNIVSGKWSGDGRIPSVRELGMQLEVNPNTVMRAYEWLENRQIIYNKRGIGFLYMKMHDNIFWRISVQLFWSKSCRSFSGV